MCLTCLKPFPFEIQSIQHACMWTCVAQTPHNLLLTATLFQNNRRDQALEPANTTAGPEFKTLNTWCLMPGWAATAEILYRGEHHPQDLLQVLYAAITVGQCSRKLQQDTCVATLTQQISLAATVRKLLWPYVQHEKQQRGKGCELTRAFPTSSQQVLHNKRMQSLERAQMLRLVQTLMTAILSLDSLQEVCRCGSNSSSLCSITQSNTTPRHCCLVNKTTEFASHDAAGGSSRDNTDHTYVRSALAYHLHKLQATFGFMLVQVFLWLREVEMTRPGFQHESQDSMALVLDGCSKLHSQHLKLVLTSLLGVSKHLSQSCSGQHRTWEHYAKAHFHGRLLPGCCHFGCTNLSGVGEAGLTTLLCSACRRARYCSVECQRAAWLEGGHSAVCDV